MLAVAVRLKCVGHANGRRVNRVGLESGVADVLVRRGAADGQVAGDIHPVNHQANGAVIDGKAARRIDVEGNSITGIDEDHVLREKVGDGRGTGPLGWFRTASSKKAEPPSFRPEKSNTDNEPL